MISVRIELGVSKSSRYRDAVGLMKRLPNYEYDQSQGDVIHSASFTYDEIVPKRHVLTELVSVARSWKSFVARVGDSTINTNQLDFSGTDTLRSIEQVMKCETLYSRAAEKVNYCKSPSETSYWPCKLLSYVALDQKDRQNNRYWGWQTKLWYTFGRFEGDRWMVDKDEILLRIQDNIRDKRIDLCPLLSQEAITSVINALPDYIDPRNDETWVYDLQHEVIAGQTIEVRTGVKPYEHHVAEPTRQSSVSLSIALRDMLSGESDAENELSEIEVPEVTYDDVGGLQDQKQTIRETVELAFNHPEVFRHLGIKPHSGILLYGPPGNGKTMLAKAIANSLRAGFYLVNGPELSSKWFGETEANIRKMFASARTKERAVIYFDEIDAIARSRSGDDADGGRYDSKVLGQLLTEMDGVTRSDRKILVIGSTNRIDVLDQAILRPGRLDFHLLVPNPDEAGRAKLFVLFLGRMPADTSVVTDELVRLSEGMSAAEIEFVCKEAALNALKRVYSIEQILASSEPIDMTMVGVTMPDISLSFMNFRNQRRVVSQH